MIVLHDFERRGDPDSLRDHDATEISPWGCADVKKGDADDEGCEGQCTGKDGTCGDACYACWTEECGA